MSFPTPPQSAAVSPAAASASSAPPPPPALGGGGGGGGVGRVLRVTAHRSLLPTQQQKRMHERSGSGISSGGAPTPPPFSMNAAGSSGMSPATTTNNTAADIPALAAAVAISAADRGAEGPTAGSDPSGDGSGSAAAQQQQQLLSDAAVTGLLSRFGAFSQSCRLDTSRKPLCSFSAIDPARWVPDAATSVCMAPLCEVPFSLFTRRSHCRGCGLVYCSSCLRRTLHDAEGGVAQRVCANCFYAGQLTVSQQINGAHPGAQPFVECFLRPDLIQQVRFVSVDGGTTSSANAAPLPATTTKIPLPSSSGSGSSNGGGRDVSPRAAAATPPAQQQKQLQNETTATSAHASPRAAAQITRKVQPPTFVSYWSSKQRLSSMSRRGHLRALPWGLLVHIAEYLPLCCFEADAANAASAIGSLNSTMTIPSVADDGTTTPPPSAAAAAESANIGASGGGGLFSFSLVCSDFYFASRCNSVWAMWLLRLRRDGAWTSLEDEDEDQQQQQPQQIASAMGDRGDSLANVDFVGDRVHHHHHHSSSASSGPVPSQPLANFRNGAKRNGNDSFRQSSINSFESVPHSPFDQELVSSTGKGNTAGVQNSTPKLQQQANNNNESQQHQQLQQNSSSADFRQQQQHLQNQKIFSPPYSLFYEFIQEAATHRATQLSASGARVHKLLSNGVRITFLGEEDPLRMAVARGFVVPERVVARKTAGGAAQQQQSSSLPGAAGGSSGGNFSLPDHAFGIHVFNQLVHVVLSVPTSASAAQSAGSGRSSSPPASPAQANSPRGSVKNTSFSSSATGGGGTTSAGFTSSFNNPAATAALAVSSSGGVRQSFVRIYDITAGRRYWSLGRMAVKSSHAAVVCYDATSRSSLTKAALLFQEVASAANSRVTQKILCGVIPRGVSMEAAASAIIPPETALSFVGGGPVASITVQAEDAVDAVERIVQAIFSRTLRGDPGSATASNVLSIPTPMDVLCSDSENLP